MKAILFSALLLAATPPADAVRAQVRKTMDAFAAMDAATFKAGLAQSVTAYEADLENKPVRLGSRDEAMTFAEGVFAQMKKMGGKMSIDYHTVQCDTAPTLAWCTVEFDYKAAMGDGRAMSQPTRNTIVLQKEGGAWKWVHWHSSAAK
ncbi:MAG TPA: nuclear transport factor 2 family protein [Thermoanaerobaculia bacterium]|jgi:ketosteroid isomerase-like protein